MNPPRSRRAPKRAYSLPELDFSGTGSPAIVQRLEQTDTETHEHRDFLELALILDGSALHEIENGESYVLRAGDFLFIPKGTRHRYSECEGLKIINVLVKTKVMEAALESLKGVEGFERTVAPDGLFLRPPPLSKAALAECERIAGLAGAEIWRSGKGRDKMIEALLVELLLTLFRSSAGAGDPALRACPDFGRIAAYMDAHVVKPACVAEMAKAAGVSARTLTRKFKLQTGMSPMEFLNGMRLSKACRLLRETSMDVKSAALACGFQDSNYFARQCKKRFGVPPSAFRSLDAAKASERGSGGRPAKKRNALR